MKPIFNKKKLLKNKVVSPINPLVCTVYKKKSTLTT